MDELIEVMAKAALDAQYGDKRRPAPKIMQMLQEGTEHDMRAALTALQSKGWVVAPVEPNEDQRRIARQYFGLNPFDKDGGPLDDLWLRAYAAMLEAAPMNALLRAQTRSTEADNELARAEDARGSLATNRSAQ